MRNANHIILDSRPDSDGDDRDRKRVVAAEATPADLMFRVVRRLRRDFAAATEPLGLNPHQVRALQVIRRAEEIAADAGESARGARPSTLAERLHVTARSATDVVDALEAKGYVAKAPDPGDRRAVRVHLTEQGRSVLSTADADRERLHAAVFQVLSEEELSQLSALLERLASA